MKARENPFRVERQHALRFRFLSGSMNSLLDRLAEEHHRGAIVGPHGSGKTTLLEEVSLVLHQQGRHLSRLRLSEFNRSEHPAQLEHFLRHSPREVILLLDGAEQLPARDWQKFLRAAEDFAGLMITSHEPGRLTTLYECRTTPTLMQELVEELSPGSPLSHSDELNALWKRHQGNVRDCLRELYDRST